MSQELRPLYGDLVIPFGDQSSIQNVESSNQDDVKAMEEQTRLKIEEAAYFRAEKRGFEPGHELEDWFHAEAQIVGSFARSLVKAAIHHKDDA